MSDNNKTYASVAAGKGGNKGKSPKSGKEWDKAVKELEKEKRAYLTPKQQKFTFLGVAAWTALIPLYLFVSRVFEANIKENVLWFGISVIAVGGLNFQMYDKLASNVRYNLLINKSNSEGKKISQEDEESILQESANYSLFSINAVYLISFLTFMFYLLPPYELTYVAAYVVATIASALIAAALVSLRILG